MIYDPVSVTKVAATGTTYRRCCFGKKDYLKCPAKSYLPEFKSDGKDTRSVSWALCQFQEENYKVKVE